MRNGFIVPPYESEIQPAGEALLQAILLAPKICPVFTPMGNQISRKHNRFPRNIYETWLAHCSKEG